MHKCYSRFFLQPGYYPYSHMASDMMQLYANSALRTVFGVDALYKSTFYLGLLTYVRHISETESYTVYT